MVWVEHEAAEVLVLKQSQEDERVRVPGGRNQPGQQLKHRVYVHHILPDMQSICRGAPVQQVGQVVDECGVLKIAVQPKLCCSPSHAA